MAGDWIKMRTRLVDERATMVICDMTGLDEFAVVGRLHAIWSWAGEHTVTGEVSGVTLKTIDRVTRCENFGEAMKAANWLEITEEGSVRFPRWKKHNSKAAKERALASERAARARKKKRDAKRDSDRDASVTNHGTRVEESRGEKNLNTRTGTAPPNGFKKSVSRRGKQRTTPSGLDLHEATLAAEKLARMVPLGVDERINDRRQWMRYVVLVASGAYQESWLWDAAEAGMRSESGHKRAVFVAKLQATAREDKAAFNEMVSGIEVPTELWNSPILGGPK